MTLMAKRHDWLDGYDGDWIIRSHNHLDARLAALLIHVCSGALGEAKQDFAMYRSELDEHLSEAERRLLTRPSALGERELVLERIEWKGAARDLQRILQAVERDLEHANPSNAYEMIAALRHAIRRHRRQENRLLQLAGVASRENAGHPQEAHHRH